MTRKSLLWAAALVFSGLALAKTYDVSFSDPVIVGTVQLSPGDYKLTLDGSNAVFADQARKAITVPAKVESETKKFNATQYEFEKQNGVDHVTYIELGGSNTRIEFGK